ncbi:FlgO family outer membrane protein [Alkalimonas sp.]|uniref:FlgO family outer membrane protein n=1 Tax=Alkalimonas sp. TaxID=1872453 RepID=UPI00263BB754|nr:FlgO family outer membrane protein [Alkalimonas sp.]
MRSSIKHSRLRQQGFIGLVAVLLLSGCASQQKWQDYRERTLRAAPVPVTAEQDASYYQSLTAQQASYSSNRRAEARLQQRYQGGQHMSLNHYVQGMMHDLMAVMDPKIADSVFAVTSFVYLDGPYDETDLLGNQLAESFMHEVHQFGLHQIDFKTTDFIRVTPEGDFVFSRDFLELREEQPIEYVLGGTMVRHQSGVMVNARLVGIDSKRVLAVAQGFIPQPVIAGLQPSERHHRVLLKQGAE